MRRHPSRQIGAALYKLKGMRSDRSHTNYNGAQVMGVDGEAGEKHEERKIPMHSR
jgi:hypothetical protein